jgi:hypothetical protein
MSQDAGGREPVGATREPLPRAAYRELDDRSLIDAMRRSDEMLGMSGDLTKWILLRGSGWAAEAYDEGRSGDPSLWTAFNPFGSGYAESLTDPIPNWVDRGNILAGAQYAQNSCHKR